MSIKRALFVGGGICFLCQIISVWLWLGAPDMVKEREEGVKPRENEARIPKDGEGGAVPTALKGFAKDSSVSGPARVAGGGHALGRNASSTMVPTAGNLTTGDRSNHDGDAGAHTEAEERADAGNTGIADRISISAEPVVHLRPWEAQSGENPRACEPPSGVPLTCCIGASARSGSVYHMPERCQKGMAVYDRTRDIALGVLASYPDSYPAYGGADSADSRKTRDRNRGCDICRIVEIAAARNLSVAFLGDSVQNQFVNGFACELMRRGFTVDRLERKWDPVMPDDKRLGIKKHAQIHVAFPDGFLSRAEGHLGRGGIAFHHYLQYKPLVWETVNATKSHDVLIFGFGLHYLPRDEGAFADYVEVLTSMMRGLKTEKPSMFLINREVSAQHHDNREGNGEFDEHLKSRNCVSHNTTSSVRTTLLRKAAEAAGLEVSVAEPALFSSSADVSGSACGQKNGSLTGATTHGDEVVVLPFYNLTSQLADLHPKECTHYCHTPYLWLPLYRTLRLALERRYFESRTVDVTKS